MHRATDGRRLGLAAVAVVALSLTAGAQPAAAQVPLPPGLPPGVYPLPTPPPAPGPVVGWCFNDGSLSLRAGESAAATFTCQAPAGGQVSLRVTGAPAGVTATIGPGTTPGAFVLTAKAGADATASYGYIEVAADGLGSPQTYRVAVSVRPIPKPTCYVAKRLTIPTGVEAGLGPNCRSEEGRSADITIDVVEHPKHGRLAEARGGWSYRADRGFVGEDHVAFRAKNQYGTTPVYRIVIRVRRPNRYERDAAYFQRVCAGAPGISSCRQGRGRTTKGGAGTGKVSHANWPRITGVYFSFPYEGGGRLTGGELNDQLTGHHGSDTIFGGSGRDVIWGDWDPDNNNGRQHDSLNGGAGSDFIYTSHGSNKVTGGAGNDFIWAFYGHGVIDCGPGIDKVRLSGRKSAYKLRSCERRGKF